MVLNPKGNPLRTKFTKKKFHLKLLRNNNFISMKKVNQRKLCCQMALILIFKAKQLVKQLTKHTEAFR